MVLAAAPSQLPLVPAVGGQVSLTLVVWLVPGSGRVTFNNQRSYLKAVTAAFVEIKTTKFTKKVSGADGAARGAESVCDGWYCWEHHDPRSLPCIAVEAEGGGELLLRLL